MEVQQAKGREVEARTTPFSFFQNNAIFMQNLGLKVSENHGLYNFAHFRKVRLHIIKIY